MLASRAGLDLLRDTVASVGLGRILITTPVWSARNYAHQVLLVEKLQKKGAEVVSLDQTGSRDLHDWVLPQIHEAVTEHGCTLINRRMCQIRLHKTHVGTPLPWTKRPYGYRLDPDQAQDSKRVCLDEVEATMVRNLFAWFVDKGAAIISLM